MSETRSQPQDTAPRLPQICAGAAAGIALLALAGWLTGVRLLAGQWDIYKPMAPLSALAFLLLGSALFCHTRWPAQRLSRRFALVAVILASLVGLLVLGQFLTGVDLGVEQALSRTNESLGQTPLGRMSPLSAIAFLLEGAALFLLLIASRWRKAPTAALLAASATSINLVVLTGYAYGAPLLYGGPIIPVSLPAAIAFVLVGVGQISLALPGMPALRAWSGATVRGRLLRAFLPFILLLVLLVGRLNVELGASLSPNAALWHSLTALATSALIVVIIGWIAGRTGDALEQAQVALRESEDRYRQLVELSPDTIAVHSEGKIVFINTAGAKLLGAANPEQLIGKPILDFVHPGYRGIVKERVRQMAEEGKEVPLIEEKFIRLNGTISDVEVTAISFTYRGKPAMQAVVRDITERKRAEELLKESEARLLYAQRVGHIGNWDWNIPTNELYWSGENYRIFGLPPEMRPSVQAFMDTIDPTDRELVTQAIEDALSGKKSYDIDMRIVRPDGLKRVVHAQAEVTWNEAGKPVRMFGTVQDITARRQAEEEIRRMALMLDIASSSIIVHDFDGRIIYVNLRTCDLYGYSRAEFAALNPHQINTPESERLIAPRIQELIDRGEASFEAANLKKDGTLLPLDVYAKVTTWGGQKVILSVATDLTERKRAEVALRAASLYTRSLIEASLDPLVTISPEGKITDVNEATEQATGVTREQLIGSDFADYFTDPDKARAGYEQVFSQGAVKDYPLAIRHTSGRITDVLYNASLYKNEAGEVQGVFAAARDITARKRAEQEKERTHALLQNTINNVKDPIMVIGLDYHLILTNQAVQADYVGNGVASDLLCCYQVSHHRDTPCEGDEHVCPLQKVRETLLPVSVEHVHIRESGEQRFVDLTASPLFGEDGALIGIVESAHDITERKQAEIILGETQEKIRRIFDSSPDTILMIDLGGTIVECNQTTVNQHGYSTKEELLGMSGYNLVVESERQRAMELMQELLARGIMHGVELTMLRRDGSQFAAETAGSVLQDPAGKPTGLVVITTNITERKRAEETLRQSEELLRVTLTNILDPVFITDDDGRFTFICPNAPGIFGYSVEEIQAMGNISKLVGDGLFSPEELEMRGEITNIERLIVDNYGRQRVFLTTVKRVSIGEGTRLYTMHDITERKRAEEVLRESEERYQFANRATFNAIWDWNLQTNALWWNEHFQTLFGYCTEEIEPGIESWTNRIHPEDLARVEAGIHAAIDSGQQSWSDQYRFRRKDGTYAEIDDRGYISREARGKPVRMIGAMQDITERKQAEQRAFELALERERVGILTKFIQDASHEFRTPLAIMQTNLYLLERLEDPAKRQRKLAQMGEQVAGITRLVDLLVEITRLDSGVPFMTQPADLNGLIGAVAAKLQTQAAAKGLTLHLALAPDLPPVPADGNRLGKALHELLDNAVRYTPAGGSVTVRSASDAAGVTVAVQDTGPGIPPDVLAHIFERFYRQDVAHTTPGFGLGLPIARAIVERHGGRLEVESQPGAGSVFQIVLPGPGSVEAAS